MHRQAIMAAAVLGVLGLGVTTSEAQPEYEFVRLETGDLLATWAWDITNTGMVVGSGVDRAGFERGVLWTDRGMEVLPTPAGYDNVRLTNGNNGGWAIGRMENADTGYSGGIWNGHSWTVVEPWDGFEHVWLDSINDAGVAVGQMDPAWGGPTPIRVQNGIVEELPILSGWQGAYAMRELADGTILGFAATGEYTISPVRWVDGQPEVLPRPNDSTFLFVTTSGWGGHIAMYDVIENEGSWIWDGQEWSQPDGIADLNGYIQGLNSYGNFVADSWNLSEPLLGIDGNIYLVNNLVDLPSDIRNYHLLALNDHGVAAGLAHTDARPWAIVLNPVPTPATLALLGCGGLLACRRKRGAVVAAVVLAPGLASASQPPRYFVDVIGLHGSGGWYNAIADDGRVVGAFEYESGVWLDGQVEFLPPPVGADNYGALDISDAGVMGYAFFEYETKPVVWVDGEPIVLEVFGGSAWGLAISNAGHVVGGGSFLPPESTSRRPFRWYEGEAIDLGSLGRVAGKAFGVNTHGHVVGRSSTRGRVTHAFFWADGVMEDLGMLPDMSHAIANAINDDDTVVGTCYSYGWGLDTPFVWEGGVMAALPTLGEYGLAKAINNDGVIVGTLIPDSIDAYGVVWIDDEVYRLDEHLVTNAAWRITEARDLNNPGQILAFASLDGERYGLLLTPACPADFNLDRLVDTRDVVAFLGAWAAGDAGADFDNNGTVDSRDVTAFLGAWASGCG